MERATKRRVLFFAEAVTLAHVARANVLARSLDPDRFDVHAAWDPRYNRLLGPLPFTFHPISSMSTEDFLRRLSRGEPMHDAKTLRGYVREELATIRAVSADVVVGDFRISLAASARLAGVQHIAVANAYWSPFGRQTFLFPEYEYPLTRIIGARLARRFFTAFKGIGFALHTRPLNVVHRENGLPPLNGDIREMYTNGDYTAYADIPELVPIPGLPPNHRHIGAVLWSPVVDDPDWWDELPPERPVVYVTLGSSGESDILPSVLEALRDFPVTIVAATAGRARLASLPSNVRTAEFLDGSRAAARASLVICNGGSPTTYQALAAGVPVLGLASNNMDQHLNMEAVCRAGAGEVLRARGIDRKRLRRTVEAMLEDVAYRNAAQVVAKAHQRSDAPAEFRRLLDEILSIA
jgi:UDP:flavonoid glycosyltransferase YjiC (YdhE family)